MSLRKKPHSTSPRVAASQANGKRSRGPATRAGRERIRDAHLRHGFYTQDEETALRVLGEKPEDFGAVVEAVMQKWPPGSEFEKLLGLRLGRALWGVERGHRMQEGYALRQAKELHRNREARLHAQIMRLKMAGASAQSLAQSVAQEYYVTTANDLALMQSLHDEGEVKETGSMALALFLQLQAPSTVAGEPDEEEKERIREQQHQNALRKIKEIFGLADDCPPPSPNCQIAPGDGPMPEDQPAPAPPAIPPAEIVPASVPTESAEKVRTVRARVPVETAKAKARRLYPKITTQEWNKREPVRQLLENLLTREADRCQVQALDLIREAVKGPSPYELAAEIAPTNPHARLMRRMQDSNLREIMRVTSLLMRIKRYDLRMQALEDQEQLPPRDGKKIDTATVDAASQPPRTDLGTNVIEKLGT